MQSPERVRIDKWLWAARLYKTRSLAADACRGGHVRINGETVKPSHFVKINEVISAKTGLITRTVRVLALIERRVGAQVAREFLSDETPPEEYARVREMKQQHFAAPPKGWGRPTKKERRDFEKFIRSIQGDSE